MAKKEKHIIYTDIGACEITRVNGDNIRLKTAQGNKIDVDVSWCNQFANRQKEFALRHFTSSIDRIVFLNIQGSNIKAIAKSTMCSKEFVTKTLEKSRAIRLLESK